MFGWLKGVLGAPKVVGDLVSGGVRALDALVFTEEERANMGQKTFETWLEVQKAIAGESTVRSMTRRVLACMIMGTFLGFMIFGGGLFYWFPAWSAYLLSLAKQLSTLALTVAIFYFGTYGVGQYLKKK